MGNGDKKKKKSPKILKITGGKSKTIITDMVASSEKKLSRAEGSTDNKTKATLDPANSELKLVAKPSEFFKEKVSQALQNHKFKPHPHTEFYLVELLSKFMSSENLFATDETGSKKQEVLALLLGESLTSPEPAVRQKGLQRLGDVSLYTAGFFSDSLHRKTVDIDYYIGMGSQAYSTLANQLVDESFQIVFSELSNRFRKFVSVLTEISYQTLFGSSLKNTKDALKVYELWLKTGSHQLEDALKQMGIVPTRSTKPS